ncbi:MAG: hypothetical protein V8S98_07270 [Lachnospiraceae bacterium]
MMIPVELAEVTRRFKVVIQRKWYGKTNSIFQVDQWESGNEKIEKAKVICVWVSLYERSDTNERAGDQFCTPYFMHYWYHIKTMEYSEGMIHIYLGKVVGIKESLDTYIRNIMEISSKCLADLYLEEDWCSSGAW